MITVFWTEHKLKSRIDELSELRYRDIQRLPSLRFRWDPQAEIGARPSEQGDWKEIEQGFRWEGRDRYAWIAVDVEVPAAWEGKSILGRFDFGKTASNHNFGFESLLYLNGEPFQGVDTNHKEVFLPADSTGKLLSLQFRLWTGLGGLDVTRSFEHEIRMAELCWLDPASDDLYFTAKAALETVETLNERQTEKQALLSALDRAFLLLDWTRPGSDAFYASVEQARSKLNQDIQSIEKHHEVTIHCIGHTHIDVAWLWRLAHTREKSARSFSTVLRLMEQYPDYIFLQTQPQLYDYIKHDYPDIYKRIKQRIQEGRWEAEGAMWLEADCNLSSGESLVRQLLMGTRLYREEFGVECKYLWLPDVFGYSWALPQILKKSGIETFMTTKISWNQYNRLPHDTFMWRGIDGTEILTHFVTTPGGSRAGVPGYSYNGKATPKELQGSWDNYQDKNINKDLLMCFGFGDGGGGVNREMLEMRRRAEVMPGLPHVKNSRAGDYFDKLQQTIAETDQYVHTWDGELYLEYHRGTYTSQAYIKKMNRKLELLYRETEWMNVLSSLLNAADFTNYPQDQLTEGWKIILRNQFHDIIPGSSIREVNEDCHKEYSEAKEIAHKAWNQSLPSIVKPQSDSEFTIFNSSSWISSGLVSLSASSQLSKGGKWIGAAGEKLEAQRLGDNWLVHVKDIPPAGFTTIQILEEDAAVTEEKSVFQYITFGIDTPHYRIRWNDQGQLTQIYDISAQREILESGKRGNVLQVFEDKPIDYEAWDIELYYQQKMQEISLLRSVQLLESGSLQAVVRFEWEYMDSVIHQDMVLYQYSRRIDFKTKIDWHEQKQLLKVAFPVQIRTTEATYDIQYGNVKRPTHWNTSWDYARFESVGHQWVDLSQRDYGVSLLNDSKYGHDVKDNQMRLTLIKSATNPDPYQDQGEHELIYALLPHRGDWVEGRTVQEAWSLNQPLTFTEGRSANEFSLFKPSVDHIMIDAVKKAEESDQIVLRVHEFTGADALVNMESDSKIVAWQECDLMERPIGNVNQEFQFEIKPYEIKTFLITF